MKRWGSVVARKHGKTAPREAHTHLQLPCGHQQSPVLLVQHLRLQLPLLPRTSEPPGCRPSLAANIGALKLEAGVHNRGACCRERWHRCRAEQRQRVAWVERVKLLLLLLLFLNEDAVRRTW